MRTPPIRRIALAIPSVLFMQIPAGVKAYASERGNWTLHFGLENYDNWTSWLAGWDGDGALVYLHNQQAAQFARKLKIPVVNISGILANPGLPTVTTDQQRIGTLAAEHLLDRCLRRFAFHGTVGIWYSDQRRNGFVARLKEAGCDCDLFQVRCHPHPPAGSRLTESKQLDAWLKTLRPPVGILISHDPRALNVLEACQRLGLRVPEDVAVIGVNNNPMIATLSNPPLTSVALNDLQHGYEAAALLDRLMDGAPPPAEKILIPCGTVVTRRSTDTLAIEDPEIAVAARFVRDHVHEPFGVERLIREASVSRTTLETGFKHWLNCSPYHYINRTRIDRAKELLATPGKLKLSSVMRDCGFRSLQRFRLVFERLESLTPAAYRKRRLQELAAR